MESKEKERAAVQTAYQSVRDEKIEMAMIGSTAEKEVELSSASQYTICSTAIFMHTHPHMLFVCRRLSSVIAVTFIFAPEACLPVSITWRQT